MKMGDRDALIVICWLAILILIFFECFYRKLKTKFGGEIQPPQGFASLRSSDEVGETSSTMAQLGMDCGGCGRGNDHGPPHYSHCGVGPRRMRFAPSFSPPATFHYLSKEVCRVPMEGEEEPPPTYEEALSYAKLVKISELSPYGFEEGWAGEKNPKTDHAVVPLTSIIVQGGNGESDLEEYTSDEDDEEESESEMDWNNNRKNVKRAEVPIGPTRILSSSTSKVSEVSNPPPPPSIPPPLTHLESVL